VSFSKAQKESIKKDRRMFLLPIGCIYCPFVLIMMIRALYRQFQNERILNAYREKIIKSGANYGLPNGKTDFAERKNELSLAGEQTSPSGRTNFSERKNKLRRAGE
jgi:hypothetical protein